MTTDLRTALEELADREGSVMARTAPPARTEALRVRARARRRRLARVGGATCAAAASVLVAVLAAQGLTSTAPMPAAPRPATSTQTEPAPAPTQPLPLPTSPPTPEPTVAAPSPPAPLWPPSVDEEEVMYGGPGPWWAVWVEVTTEADLQSAGTEQLLEQLRALGYDSAGTPVRCVVGSQEALGLDPVADSWGWPLYFRSAEDAQTFVGSWDRPVAGVVPDADLACDWG